MTQEHNKIFETLLDHYNVSSAEDMAKALYSLHLKSKIKMLEEINKSFKSFSESKGLKKDQPEAIWACGVLVNQRINDLKSELSKLEKG